MNSLKRIRITGMSILLALLILIGSLASCTYGSGSATTGERIDFTRLSAEELCAYVEIGQYKGLEIALGDRTKGEAVWEELEESSQMKLYPEEHVYYYVTQIRAEYRYHAEKAGVSYEEMLKSMSVDEGDILKEAKELTKSDVLYALVLKLESIALTEEEKQELFDRYVEKYVSEYGYTKEYVEENMSEEIYGSMLYDKTTEFLIINNNFK